MLVYRRVHLHLWLEVSRIEKNPHFSIISLAFQRCIGWKMKHGWLGEAVIVNLRSEFDKMILSLIVSECKPPRNGWKMKRLQFCKRGNSFIFLGGV